LRDATGKGSFCGSGASMADTLLSTCQVGGNPLQRS